MKTIKPVVLVICFLAFSIHSLSQEVTTGGMRQYLDKMFEKTLLDKVPTGFLLDYAVDLVDFNKYDGTEISDSNYVSIGTFENALFSLQSADVLKTRLTGIQTYLENFESEFKSNDLNIGIIFYKYNYIAEDALTAGKIDYLGGQVFDKYDANGAWINPYDESTIVCCSPNINDCTEGAVNFNFNTADLFSNATVEEILFDAGTGNGFSHLEPSGTFYYPSSGRYELKFKIKADGEWFQCHSYINITSDLGAKLSSSTQTQSVHTATTYDGFDVSALVSSYLRGSTLQNPFIVVEGFDPWELVSALTGEKPIRKNGVHVGSTNYDDFYTDFWKNSRLSLRYDLIYIDWDNSLHDIRANAKLLQYIINNVNQQKDPNDTSGIVVMGQSMGGLIARYALMDMESSHKPHNVTTFISHDVPHLGANVPLGSLYFVRSFLNFIDKYDTIADIADIFINKRISKVKKALRKTLDATSVQQMLFNNVVAPSAGDLHIDNTIHDAWQKQLSLFGFPKGDNGKPINNIAIVNGRTPLPDSSLVHDGHILYLDGYIKTHDWTNVLPFNAAYKLMINSIIRPYSSINSSKEISNLEIKFRKQFHWIITKTYKLFSNASYNAPSTGPYLDEYPGSTYSLTDMSKNHHGSNFFGKLDYTFGIADRIMFIPVASALAINENIFKNMPQRDYYSEMPVSGQETPFSAYYICNESRTHISLDEDMATWLFRQLKMRIDGPDNVEVYGDYSLTGSFQNVTWSTSDRQIAVIDEDGHLTATGNGFVTITATSCSDGKKSCCSKKVMVSFPDMTLSAKYIINEGYRISANVTGADADSFKETMKKHCLEYEWSLIDDNMNRTTTYSSENTYSFIPTPGQSVTVCVRLVHKYEHRKTGKTYSMQFKPRTFFELNYSSIIINSASEVYFIRGNSFDAGKPEDLTVIFGGLPPADDVPTMTRIMQMVNGEHCYLAYAKWDGKHDYEDSFSVDIRGIYSKPENDFARWTFDYFKRNDFINLLAKALTEAGTDKILTPIRFQLKDKDNNIIHNLVLPIVCSSGYERNS